MFTERGPVLLECNARSGDPETQAILPLAGVVLGPLLAPVPTTASAAGLVAAADQARPGPISLSSGGRRVL
jgi:phosphoribosylamine-glycine ligase